MWSAQWTSGAAACRLSTMNIAMHADARMQNVLSVLEKSLPISLFVCKGKDIFNMNDGNQAIIMLKLIVCRILCMYLE